MSDAAGLRDAFADFLGEERFAKFVAQGFQPRLKFWQEREWERFNTAYPEFHVDLATLEVALRVCHVHRMELLPCTVATFDGSINYASDYLEARMKRFPHAAVDRIAEDGNASPQNGSWYCPACRVARTDWQAEPRPQRSTSSLSDPQVIQLENARIVAEADALTQGRVAAPHARPTYIAWRQFCSGLPVDQLCPYCSGLLAITTATGSAWVVDCPCGESRGSFRGL